MSTRFGGKVTMRTSSGILFAGRGTFNIQPARTSIEAVTNDDASLARVGTNQPVRVELSLEDRGIDYDALMKAGDIDFTAVEEFTGTSHLVSKAFFTGDPQINRRNGEVTGLTLSGEAYQRINN